MSGNAPSPLHVVRSQGKESRHSQVVCGRTQYRQNRLCYPLGLTVIGCLHKQKDPIKPKDLMYCSIYLAPLFRFCSAFNFSQVN